MAIIVIIIINWGPLRISVKSLPGRAQPRASLKVSTKRAYHTVALTGSNQEAESRCSWKAKAMDSPREVNERATRGHPRVA
eukprot:890022-Karenia_brevis.AAC.1